MRYWFPVSYGEVIKIRLKHVQKDKTTQFQAPDFFKILVLLAFSCAILIQLFIYAYGGTLIMEEVIKAMKFIFTIVNFSICICFSEWISC